MWIFGYGSLTWKADFPYEKKIIGYIKGYDRRFFQYSIDHRGTPEKPGRVVTLIPSKDSESRVYGVAYKIREEHIIDVVKQLDYREKGGYERVPIIFYPKNSDNNPVQITIYLANQNNPQYAGNADLLSIAKQVVQCSGMSGSNIEYVCNLADAMREIAPEIYDEHLFNLEKLVKSLIKAET